MYTRLEFTQEMADLICERLTKPESLRSICADESMPAMSTVFKWLTVNKEFAEQYAYAREIQADAFFDEVKDIADTPQVGVKTTRKPNGDVEVVEGDMIDHRRLRIDARKWMAGKLRPKKYGDKQAVQLGGDPENPLKHEDVTQYTDEMRARALAAFIAKTKAKAQ